MMTGPQTETCCRIGTSGYQYRHWQGVFYPPELPEKRWFEHYAQHFDTVEINNTFYRLPPADVFAEWREQAPQGFCYALKFSRYGSHIKRLKNGEDTTHRFIEAAHGLGPLLGPILVQLPPHWQANGQRLDRFLEAASDDYRWAVEFRDPRWLCDEIFRILERHKAALCIHDMIPDHPRVQTTDWVYVRFHGSDYGGSYSPQFLTAEARRIRSYLDSGLDVFVYFNNDLEGHAVRNAMDLKRYLKTA